jgi:hypothetical protein
VVVERLVTGVSGVSLRLESGGTPFSAVLLDTDPGVELRQLPGSEVELTGVLGGSVRYPWNVRRG